MASGVVGDSVWFDSDAEGLQDPGEPGIPGVDVRLYECLDAGCGSTVLLGTDTTDADGHCEFVDLETGIYRVEVDTGSMSGDLTTPGSFTVPLGSPIDSEHVFDGADFGVGETLPVAGLDADRLGWLAIVLMALGWIFVLSSGWARREH